MANNDDIRAAMEVAAMKAVQVRSWSLTNSPSARSGAVHEEAVHQSTGGRRPKAAHAGRPDGDGREGAGPHRTAAAGVRGSRDERADKTHLGHLGVSS